MSVGTLLDVTRRWAIPFCGSPGLLLLGSTRVFYAAGSSIREHLIYHVQAKLRVVRSANR